MRKRISLVAVTSIALLLLSAGPASAAGTWQAPVSVTSALSAGQAALIVTADDSLVATWVEYDGGAAYAETASSVDHGVTWTAPMRLSGGGAFDPHVLEMDDGTLIVSWELLNWPTGDIQSATSVDGGINWSLPVSISANGDWATMHEIVASGTQLVAIWALGNTGTGTVQTATSADRGLTWTAPLDVSVPGAPAFDPEVQFVGGDILVVWSRNNGGNFIAQRSISTDGGATWGVPLDLSPAGLTAVEVELLVAPDGVVTLMWRGWNGTYPYMAAVRSLDNGVSWSPPVQLSTIGDWALSSTTVVAPDNRVISTWLNYPGGGSTAVATVSSSIDGGLTWTTPVEVPLPGNDAMETVVGVANDGTATLAVSANNSSVWTADSVDGGATWTTALQLSTQASAVAPVIAFDSAANTFIGWYGTAVQVDGRFVPAALAPAAALAATGIDPTGPLLVAAALLALGISLAARGHGKRTAGQVHRLF